MSENNENNLSVIGTGAVLPPGTLPKIDIGKPENITVKILKVADEGGMEMVRAEYPDGFIKNHQAETVEQLLGVVTNQLRGRYGVTTFEFESIPTVLKSGETIKLKGVEYGT